MAPYANTPAGRRKRIEDRARKLAICSRRQMRLTEKTLWKD